MNVYDSVNNLARAIKESNEYLDYKKIRNQVKDNPEIKEKISNFEKIRYEEQYLAMQGEQQNEEKMAKLQEMYQILVQNPVIKEYFDKEVRFNLMIADVNKIIGESIKDVLNI